MHEAITTLFSLQSTEALRIFQDDEPNDDDILVSFSDLQFDPEKDNVPDNMIMSGKQFNILNNKLDSLLQIQEDIGVQNIVYGFEMEYMLNSQENRFRSLVENIKKKLVERLKVHDNSFEYEIKKLRDVAKERRELFVEQVKTIKESIDLMMVELKS